MPFVAETQTDHFSMLSERIAKKTVNDSKPKDDFSPRQPPFPLTEKSVIQYFTIRPFPQSSPLNAGKFHASLIASCRAPLGEAGNTH